MSYQFSQAEIDQWSSRDWRLNNLYFIKDKYGAKVKFKLNFAQRKLLQEMHFLNIILKARQLGFSTFIQILALDCCLFNSNFDAGVIADTTKNAANLLSRAKYAYDNLPADLREAVTITTDNVNELVFSNGSSFEVGVSLRSGTKNLLHVSEYGKICAKHPEKAKEIKSGALNTLAQGQLGFIESTAEGKGGDFHDKCVESEKIADMGRTLSPMEWKFHFYAWWQDPSYISMSIVPITVEMQKYFKDLEDEDGVVLSLPQKYWYVSKHKEQGDDMWKEYPSTPKESFLAAKDGAYFAKEFAKLRKRGCIGRFPVVANTPCHTFWDWGIGDNTVIWVMQVVQGRFRFVGYYENSGEGLAHYLDWLDKWRVTHNATWANDGHYAPHDFRTRRPAAKVTTLEEIAFDLGYRFDIVDRTQDKLSTIQVARQKIADCDFDETACDVGITHMENYARDWDEKLATWKPYPRHDEHSHCADGFFTFTDGFINTVSSNTHSHKRKEAPY